MSTEHPPQSDPGGPPTRTTDAQPPRRKKPRSPLERALVWSGIGILLVVLAIEASTRFAFQSAYTTILDELRKAEEQDDYRVTRSMVTRLFGGKEPASSETIRVAVGQERLDSYVWRGLLKNRSLYLHYSIQGTTEEPEVMAVSTIRPEN